MAVLVFSGVETIANAGALWADAFRTAMRARPNLRQASCAS
jgi:hypothetical protein